jgi:hypothetical protein
VIRLLVLLLLISTAVEAQVGDPTPIRRTVAYPPVYVRAEEGLEGLVDEVLRLWPESALMIAEGLGLTELAPVEIVLLKHTTWTRWSRGLLPEWGVGFANWPGGPIAIDAGRAVRDPGRFSQILRHEISHVYLGQRLNGRRPPTWFVEGVAQIQSGDWSFGDTMGLVQVASAGALPPLSRLQASFPVGGRSAQLAYRVSRQAVLEIDRRGAERGGWRAMLGPLAAGESFDSALAAVSGLRMTAFEAMVENRLRIRYGWLAAVASASSLFTFMTLLFVVGAVRARLRTRQRLREMEDEEALLGFDSTT